MSQLKSEVETMSVQVRRSDEEAAKVSGLLQGREGELLTLQQEIANLTSSMQERDTTMREQEMALALFRDYHV